MQRKQCWCMIQFLSTLSLRRATYSPKRSRCTEQYFYPRSPCGERQLMAALLQNTDYLFLSTLSLRRATFSGDHGHINGDISIHALLAESDHDTYVIMEAAKVISIHALLAESDAPRRDTGACHRDFYPRSPCGERPAQLREGP